MPSTQRKAMRGIAGSALLLLASAAGADLPGDLRVGTRVEAEGRRIDDQTIAATEIELKAARSGTDEVFGAITAVDVAENSLTVHGVRVRLTEKAALKHEDGTALALADFAVGQFAEAEGVFQHGRLEATEVERKTPKPDEQLMVELGGVVTKVSPGASTFEVLGITVMVNPKTQVELR